ncbi:unnamed protein product [Amaranthus hypochondriacus]
MSQIYSNLGMALKAPPLPSSPPSSTHQFRTGCFSLFFHSPPRPDSTHLSFIPKASSQPDPEPESDSFEDRLSQVRLRYRSGTGKKAEIRKIKKGKQTEGSGSSGSGVFLPPVPLKDAVSSGLKVDFGFSPYSERVNGRIAGLGLAGLLAVELATGKSVINYHTPAIVFLQVYFMAAASALYLKYEKEKISVWPETKQ